MKLKIGQKVRIGKDLKIKRYGSAWVVDDMLKFKGKEVTVSSVNSSRKFRIIEDDSYYCWTIEMTNLLDLRYRRPVLEEIKRGD